MAYTKAPVFNSYQIKRVPSVGSPFVSGQNVSNPVTLKYVNCFPVSQKQWGTDPKNVIYKREEFDKEYEVECTGHTGFVGINAISAENTQYVFFKLGGQYRWVRYNAATPTEGIVQSGSANEAKGCIGIDDTNTTRIVYLDYDGNIYTCDEFGTSPAVIDPGLTSGSLIWTYGIVFLNGYLFAVGPDGKSIYNSAPGGNFSSWSDTDFIQPELYGDNLAFIAKHKNHLVAFGKSSIEFFYDAAQPVGSPLARQEAYASRVGAVTLDASRSQYAQIGDDIYFVGKSTSGLYNIFRIRDFKVEEVGSPAIIEILNFPGRPGGIAPSSSLRSIEVIYSRGISMVGIMITSGSDEYTLVYNPENNSWWEMTAEVFNITKRLSTMLVNPSWYFNTGSIDDRTPVPFFLKINTTDSPNKLEIYMEDSTASLEALVYSDVIDFDVNFNKHITRVDALGDYGSNAVNLAICPNPTYVGGALPFTPLGVRDQAANRSKPLSWYNLGRLHRFVLRLSMDGPGRAYHEGFDVVYNLGWK